MSPSFTAVIGLYKLGDNFFKNSIATLDDATANKQINLHVNPMIWQAGHLTMTRAYALELLGQKVDFPSAQMFKDKYDASTDYPSMEEVAGAWADISARLVSAIAEATDDVLSKEFSGKMPHGVNTVEGAVVFFAYHEAWHLGQIAIDRKSKGMEGLVPY